MILEWKIKSFFNGIFLKIQKALRIIFKIFEKEREVQQLKKRQIEF